MAKQLIFVFGSNLAGIHGAGAADYARRNYGAELGVGVGPTGKAYAIPTKDRELNTLSLEVIANYVKDFLCYARIHPDLDFFVTAIGCGLAGYIPEQIAPMFNPAPENCSLPLSFRDALFRLAKIG